MKHYYLFTILLVLAGFCCQAQAPSPPSNGDVNGGPCTNVTSPKVPTVTIVGPSSFTFTSFSSFSTTNPKTFTVTVQSKNTAYKLWVAGVITNFPSSSTNTIIPITTFTIQDTNIPGSGPKVPFTLQNAYQLIATSTGTSGNATETHNITITLNPVGNMDSFLQQPGTHTLTIYFCLCN